MSVQTQIDRISWAVSAALAALTEKGVTVPAGTKVDGLASLIAAIEAGGGGGGIPSHITELAGGTYTAASNQGQTLTIKHGMKKKPSIAFIWSASTNTGSMGWALIFGNVDLGAGWYGSAHGTAFEYSKLGSATKRNGMISDSALNPSLSNAGTSAAAGDTFYWLAWMVE